MTNAVIIVLNICNILLFIRAMQLKKRVIALLAVNKALGDALVHHLSEEKLRNEKE
jgi:hypothetical protein